MVVEEVSMADKNEKKVSDLQGFVGRTVSVVMTNREESVYDGVTLNGATQHGIVIEHSSRGAVYVDYVPMAMIAYIDTKVAAGAPVGESQAAKPQA